MNFQSVENTGYFRRPIWKKIRKNLFFFQILNAYSSDGIDFLDRAFNSPPDYLEDLTGLSEMRNTSDVDVIELSDDDF